MTDPKLAQTINLEPGTFHCYYKPSFANFDPDQSLKLTAGSPTSHFEELEARKYPTVADQLLNQKYMDRFEFDADFITGQTFAEALQKNQDMLTAPLLDSFFDRAFSKRTFNVQFLFNPNLKQFNRV